MYVLSERALLFTDTLTHTYIYVGIQYTTVEVVGDGKVRRRLATTFWGKKLPKWIVVWEWS